MTTQPKIVLFIGAAFSMMACSKSNEQIIIDICDKAYCSLSDAERQEYDEDIQFNTDYCIERGNYALELEVENGECLQLWRDYNLCVVNLECDEFTDFMNGSNSCETEAEAWWDCSGFTVEIDED